MHENEERISALEYRNNVFFNYMDQIDVKIERILSVIHQSFSDDDVRILNRLNLRMEKIVKKLEALDDRTA